MRIEDSDDCQTCGGDGWLVGDAVDKFGEHVDDVQPCHECNADADAPDEYEHEAKLEREHMRLAEYAGMP